MRVSTVGMDSNPETRASSIVEIDLKWEMRCARKLTVGMLFDGCSGDDLMNTHEKTSISDW